MRVSQFAPLLRSISLLLLLAIMLANICAQQPPAKKKNQTEPPPAKEESAPQEEQILSLETNQVVLNITVTDASEKYVRGLKPENFKIQEDLKPQTIVSFGYEETPFAAAILLDLSGSMTYKMSLARSACARFAAGIRTGDTVAIFSFSESKVKMMQDFTEVKDVDPIVWDTDPKGETPLYDAIVEASEALGKRPERRRAIVLLSDGADTHSKATFDKAMKAAQAANVTIYSVNLSDSALGKGQAQDAGAQIIRDFALKTGGRFFPSPGGSKLRDAFELTVDELRNQYTIVYEPTNEKQDGKWRAVNVTLNNPSFTARTRQGYYAPKPSDAKSHKID